MTDQLKRRGPDGEGFLISNDADYCATLQAERGAALVQSLSHHQHISFGHRRLAVTDLGSSAAQPMADSTRRYWIVFNGQIYNHLQLRQELEALGYSFRSSHSDTEVILNAYRQWGVDSLCRFNGMWAFCIWDSQENTLFLARDRAGKQPLFYTVSNNIFYFASEINAFEPVKNIQRELDDFSIYNYLTYSNIPGPVTIYKGIYKLPAAHYMLFKPGEPMETTRFWHPENISQNNTLSEGDILDTIKKLLNDSVHLRQQADANVGILLSGGVDSSINLACMSRKNAKPVNAYSVGFENSSGYKNEIGYARRVADLFGARFRELIVTSDVFFKQLPVMASCFDEPVADTANIPIYMISQLAYTDGMKVLLSGEGADEVFIGYEHWRLIYEFEKIFRNRPTLAGLFESAHRNSPFRHKRRFYMDYSYKIKNNWPAFWSGTELRTERDKRSFLSADFLDRIGGYHSFTPKKNLYNAVESSSCRYDTYRWMTINDLQNRLPDQLLARLDRMTMANSIEGRNPFLDVALVEFMLSVPSSLKTKHNTEKYLLKKAFEDVLPHEIIYRKKDSFTVPLLNLFEGNKRKQECMEVIRSFNAETRIFSNDYINRLDHPGMISEFWNLFSLALWRENHK